MELNLFNTQSRQCEAIVLEPQKPFKTYCCGPTVYGPAHIGNFRTYVVQDVLVRLLKLLKVNVCYVRNITDVDDKTIRGAHQNNQSLQEFTTYWTQRFHNDCERLNLLPPTVEPKATETIDDQLALIQLLMDNGYAYARNGSVYFRISACKDYGKLSHLNERELQTQDLNSAEQSNDADEYERDQIADFALWKAYKPEDGTVAWDSPWGRGRPGWHTECSAMTHRYLGGTLDVHSGGVDLVFPHHENEIAQSESAYKVPFVKHWLHIAHLRVNGQKMSKKLGNLYTLDSLQEQHYEPSTVRYALIAGHYRKPLNFTFENLNAAQSALHKIYAYTQILCKQLSVDFANLPALLQQANLPDHPQWLQPFFDALLHDDLNTPKALGCLFSFMGQHPQLSLDEAKTVFPEWLAVLYALGIQPVEQRIRIPADIQELAEKRWQCKRSGDYQAADNLRKALMDKGWRVLDNAQGYRIELL